MTSTPFNRATHYLSGDPIRAGERVKPVGDPGVIEFVLASGDRPAAGHEWYAERFGHGFMVFTRGSGRIFKGECDEYLEFVGRADVNDA